MPVSKLNYINVGPKRTFNKSGEEQTLPDEVDKIFDHIDQTDVKKVAIHFHSGLIWEKFDRSV